MAKKRRHIHLLEKMQRGKASMPALSKKEIRELEELSSPGGQESPDVVDSQEKVAKAFGVAVRTVARWCKDGMPVTSQGKYNLEDIRHWKTNREGRISGGGKGIYADKLRWEVARLQEDVEKRKIENAVRRGKLIFRDKVEKELVNISLAMKRALLSLPNTLSLRCFGQEPRRIKVIVQEEVENIVCKISEARIFDQKKGKRKT